jgi:undecaprenyl-phosphate galactose phosphotransferase
MQDIYSQNSSEVNFFIESTFTNKIKKVPLKRTLDFIFSLAGLIILSPLFLVIGLMIKMSSGGHIIYCQERIGKGGKTFKCYKFRTMCPDADDHLKTLLKIQPELLQEWTKNRKLKKDPRITKIGHFLRNTSLDELPQLWNVLKGELSLVGPRPVVHAELLTYYKTKAAKILSVRPGLTGLWQISGRNNIKYEDRVIFDEKYVDEQSLLLDLQILLKTVPVIIYGDGAY